MKTCLTGLDRFRYASYPGLGVRTKRQWGWEYRFNYNGCINGGTCYSWETTWNKRIQSVKTWHFNARMPYLAERCWRGWDTMADCNDMSASFNHVYRKDRGFGSVWRIERSTHWPSY